MRIAVITPEFPPTTIGGGGVVVEAVTTVLATRNEVRVFSADHGHPGWWASPTADRCTDFEVLRYPLLPLLSNVDYLRTVLPPSPPSLKALLADLTRWSPDVAHIHGCGYAVSDVGAWAMRRSGIPYLLTDHGLPQTPERKSALLRTPYRYYERTIMSATVLGATAFSAVSLAEADLCAARFGLRPVVIVNGVTERQVGDRTPRHVVALSALESASRRPVVVAAGRITAVKGFDVLVDAMRHVDNREAHCFIAGEALDRSYLSSLVDASDNRTTFLGSLSRTELLDLMALATVVVVPSLHEPFGLVALEAISAGARLIASDVGGLRDLVRKPFGTLVPPGDVRSLTAAIEVALSKGRLQGNELLAAQDVLGCHRWPAIAAQYESVLQSIAPSRRPQGTWCSSPLGKDDVAPD